MTLKPRKFLRPVMYFTGLFVSAALITAVAGISGISGTRASLAYEPIYGVRALAYESIYGVRALAYEPIYEGRALAAYESIYGSSFG